MQVAVVILNWNGEGYLREFLPTLIKHSPTAKVYVADNASTDGSVEYVQQHHPEIAIVENEQNGGFAKGYNDALKRIPADYYVLINSDVEVTPNWLDPMTALLNTRPDSVAVQPKIRAYANRTHFEHAGAAGGYIDGLGYPFCRGRVFNNTEADNGQYDTASEIFWATGACMMIRSELFHEFGGFDEDYFAHMEEIDLCWRLKNAGYEIWYTPESTVYHVGGGTLDYQSPFKTYLNFRNSLYTLAKNDKGFFWGKIFVRLWLDGIAGTKFFLEGNVWHTFEVIYAHLSFYQNLSKTLKKRKYFKRFWSNPNNTGIYRGSIVSGHFLTRKVNRFSDINPARID